MSFELRATSFQYIKLFHKGSQRIHKEPQRFWVDLKTVNAIQGMTVINDEDVAVFTKVGMNEYLVILRKNQGKIP